MPSTCYADTVRSLRAKAVRLPWVESLREHALKTFEAKGFPERSWESWKYYSPKELLATSFQSPRLLTPVDRTDPLFKDARCRIVFVNGLFSPQLSSQAPGNIDFSELWSGLFNQTDLEARLGRNLNKEENPFLLVNTFSFQDGAFIRIPKGRTALEPLHLFFLSSPDQENPVASNARILVIAEEGSQASVVCHYYGIGTNPSFENAGGEIYLDQGAKLEWVNLQHQNKGEGTLFCNLRAYLRNDARLEMVTFSRGGKIVRNEVLADLEGPGAVCNIGGLSVLSGETRVFNEVTANHRAPATVSRQFYKNILDETSVAEFNSLAYVFPGAQKSDSNQLNKNLLLSDDARVYSRPKLKIYADDVQASHGSANGQGDTQELFYLRSRGLDRRTARLVLAFGFAEEVLQRISLVPVRKQLEEIVRSALEAMIRE